MSSSVPPAPASLRLFGIPNCDTVRKARAWLDSQDVPHQFVDFKREGVDAATLRRWSAALGWDALLNRRGTTWRGLDAGTQQAVHDADSAAALMQAQPSLIKRPVVEWPDGGCSVGFDAQRWAERLHRRAG